MKASGKQARWFGALAAVAAIGWAAAPAHAAVVIDITDGVGAVDVAASGSLDLTDAVFDHVQPYLTGIIPGGSNWYIALGDTPGMDWYQLTSTELPFGADGSFHSLTTTAGDAFSIWGFGGGAPLVGVPTGYTSGTPLSATMSLPGETIAGMTLIPGTYTFTLPHDVVTLNIAGASGGIPEPGEWALMLVGFGLAGAALRRAVKPGRLAAAAA